MNVRELVKGLTDLAHADPTVLDHEVYALGDWHAMWIISAEECVEAAIPFPVGDPYRDACTVVVPL